MTTETTAAALAEKNERNARVQTRYDELMAEGKRGHYETMFRVVREEVDAALLRAGAAKVPEPDLVREALRLFVRSATPVCKSIDPRGHSWSEAYLDQALPFGVEALATPPAPDAGVVEPAK